MLYLRPMKTITKNFENKPITSNQDSFLLQIGQMIKDHFEVKLTCGESETETPFGKTLITYKGLTWKIQNDDFQLIFSQYGNRSIELYLIKVEDRGKGLGSFLFDMINEVSVKTQTTIFLRPTYNLMSSRTQLDKFYHKHNLKRCCKDLYWSNIQLFNK